MPLTSKPVLVLQVKNFLENNKTEDPEKALQDFSEFIVDLIQNEIRAATLSGLTTTVVTGASTGTGIQVVGTGILS